MKNFSAISGSRWGVVFLFLVVLLMNYLSQAVPFNGQTNADVSAKYDTFFTPAGYAFSIWGFIYLALGIYTYYQAFQASENQQIYDRIAPVLMVNFLANSAWLPAFQYELLGLSVILMLILLLTLIYIQKLLIKDHTLSLRKKAWIRIPFSLYLGWISVAAIVNIAVFAEYAGWNAWGISETTWAVIMAIAGALLAFMMLRTTYDLVYVLVFVWAFIAIAVKQSESELLWWVTLGLAAVLLIADFVALLQQYKRNRVVNV